MNQFWEDLDESRLTKNRPIKIDCVFCGGRGSGRLVIMLCLTDGLSYSRITLLMNAAQIEKPFLIATLYLYPPPSFIYRPFITLKPTCMLV